MMANAYRITVAAWLFLIAAQISCKKIEPGVSDGKTPASPVQEFTRIKTTSSAEIEIYLAERGGFCFAVAAGSPGVAMVQVPCAAKIAPPAEAPAASVETPTP